MNPPLQKQCLVCVVASDILVLETYCENGNMYVE
jgi:hypothetical protein